MKNLIKVFMLLVPVLMMGQTTTENYVKTTAYKAATPDGTGIIPSEKVESITYFDGLGRPKQQVALNSAISSVHSGNTLLNWSGSWTLGTGTSVPFTKFGAVAENNRINGQTPYGDSDVLWQCGNDPALGADGGYNTSFFTIDKTQSYRYRVWVKKEGHLTNGNTYHGTRNVNNLNGTANSNPYFWSGDLPQLNQWYLIIGVVHPFDYAGTDTGISGVYDTDGNKVKDGTEFMWRDNTINANLRNYLYSATDTSVRQYFWNPVVELLDGTEAPIDDITEGVSIKDIVTHIEYDALGRQPRQFLPYVSQLSGGDFDPYAITETLDFYNTEKYELTENPYSESQLEPSIIGKPIQQGAPGNKWALNSSEDPLGNHTVKYKYSTNSVSTATNPIQGDDIQHFAVGFYEEVDTEKPHLMALGLYAESQLYKNVTYDENWTKLKGKNHTVEQYTNKLGQMVLKRTYENNIPHDIYYVYDDFGNLTYVISPKATDDIVLGSPAEDKFKFRLSNESFSVSRETTISGFVDVDYLNNLLILDFNLYSNGSENLRNGSYGTDTGLPDMFLYHLPITGGAGYDISIQNGLLHISGSGGFSSIVQIIQIPIADIILNPDVINNLSYQYHYDYKNRLVEKKVPGKAWEYIIYDKLNRPILTQTGNLRANNQWLFTKYDVFGRVVYTGKYLDTASCSSDENCRRVALQNTAKTTSLPQYETKNNGAVINGQRIDYTRSTFPNPTNLEVHTINFYDDYLYDYAYNGAFNQNPNNYIDPENQPVANTAAKTRGLATGSKIRVLGTNDWIVTTPVYDTKGRALYTRSHNKYLGTKDEIQSTLDFEGKILKTITTHEKGTTSITTTDFFTYDILSRLHTHKQQVATSDYTSPLELITQNHYDGLGMLSRKDVGGTTTLTQDHATSFGLQKIDYTYNIRGWLKEMNNVNDINISVGDGPDDLFNFKINYASTDINLNPDVAPLYNGNISETLWRSLNDDQSDIKAYGYQYDALNRLKKADFAERADDQSPFTDSGDYSEIIQGYDKNGNIAGLTRTGKALPGVEIMDDLSYSYDGNQLVKVSEINIGNQNDVRHLGFVDGTNTDNDYLYDGDGNMIEDKNKGVSTIAYNYLNLPTAVTIDGAAGGEITYVYDATGAKLEKTVDPNAIGPDEISQYAGSYIYTNGDLQMFAHPEGYIEPKNPSDLSLGFDYAYQYVDHLGNVRLTYKDTDDDQTIDPSYELISEKNYFPLGLQHHGYNTVVSSFANGMAENFGYNGKENNPELGLEWMDFGARNYDPTLGRWMNLDPLAEKMRRHSPYNYAFNNPVFFIDPDGMAPISGSTINQHYQKAAKKARNIAKQGEIGQSGPDDVIIWYKDSNGKNQNYRITSENLENFVEFASQQDSEFLGNFALAVSTCLDNCGGQSIENAINDSSQVYQVIENSKGRGSSSYQGNGGKPIIAWDDTGGLEVENGDVLSPATVLEHEFDHITDRMNNPIQHRLRGSDDSDPNYTSAEEKRVIKGRETETARANGEISPTKPQSRYSHGKKRTKLVQVKNSISTKVIKQ